MLTARNKMAMMIPRAANVPTINRASVETKSLSRTTVVESLGGFPPTNTTDVNITSSNRSFRLSNHLQRHQFAMLFHVTNAWHNNDDAMLRDNC